MNNEKDNINEEAINEKRSEESVVNNVTENEEILNQTPENQEEIKSEQLTFHEISNDVVNYKTMKDGYEENKDIHKISKSNKVSIIVISSIVSAIIIFIVIVCVVVANNPKLKVAKALKATSEELDQRSTFTKDAAGMDDFTELYTKQYNVKFGTSIKSTNLPQLADMKNIGLNCSMDIDNLDKKYEFDLNGQYNGTSVVNMLGYSDNKKFMFNIPQLHGSWFTCDAEHFQTQYNNSIFGRSSKMPKDEDISFKVFEDEEVRTVGIKKLNEQFIKVYLERNKADLNTISNNIKVEKSADKKEISVGGNSQKCTVYNVSISSDDANKFMNSVYDYLLNDKQGQLVMNEYFGNNNIQYVDSLFHKSVSGKQTWKDEIKYLKSNLTFDDANIKVYVDNKGRAAGVDLDIICNVNNQKYPIKLSSEYKGADNIGNDIDASLVFNDGKEDSRLDFTYDKKNEGNSTQDTYVMEYAKDNNRIMNASWDSKYDKVSKTLEGTFALIDIKKETTNVDYKGSFNFDKTANKLKFDFDDFNIKSDSNGKQENINCDASFSIEPYDKNIEEPKGEKLELFKLSQSKLIEIAQEVQSNYNIIVSTLK